MQQQPAMPNLCPGDTIRFMGDSLNQLVYGTITVAVYNSITLLTTTYAVSSYYNVATFSDHILTLGDTAYLFNLVPPEYGFFTFNCLANVQTADKVFPTLKFFPNPAADKIEITCEENMSSIIIYDELGQEIMHLTLKSKKQSVNISELPKGIYIVRVVNELYSATKKFLKM